MPALAWDLKGRHVRHRHDQHPRCDSVPTDPTERGVLIVILMRFGTLFSLADTNSNHAQANLQQKLQQKLSPQQIQLMKLLQVPTVELEARIKEELEVNPALEEGRETVEDEVYGDQVEDDRGQRTKRLSTSTTTCRTTTPRATSYAVNNHVEEDDRDLPFGGGETFAERLLLSQVGPARDRRQAARWPKPSSATSTRPATCAATCKPSSTTWPLPKTSMADVQELEEALRLIQDFDPPGVGARDLQECLLIQLRRLESAPNTPRSPSACCRSSSTPSPRSTTTKS